jgi:glutamate racemase
MTDTACSSFTTNFTSVPRTLIVFDSGLGGAFIVPALAACLPSMVQLVYVGDHAWMPYGSRSLMELQTRLVDVFSSLRQHYGEDALIIIACNTASTASNHAPWLLPCDREAALGKRVDIMTATIPAMAKHYATQAARLPSSSRLPVALLATPFTVQQQWFKNLFIQAFMSEAPQCKHQLQWYDVPCKQLASLIEHAAPPESIEAVLQDYMADLPSGASEGLVLLGCTHYLYEPIHQLVQQQVPQWHVWLPHQELLKAIQLAGSFESSFQQYEPLPKPAERSMVWHSTLPYHEGKYATLAQHIVQLGIAEHPPLLQPLEVICK